MSQIDSSLFYFLNSVDACFKVRNISEGIEEHLSPIKLLELGFPMVIMKKKAVLKISCCNFIIM